MTDSQDQKAHHILLSDDKDKNKRIVKERLEGKKKKLYEKVEKQGRTPQITIEPETARGKGIRI